MRKPDAKTIIDRTHRHSADNYHPLPVVLVKGRGTRVWDVQGHEYFDMLSAYSALNFGHNHPRLKTALIRQMSKLSVTSRAFYTDVFADFVGQLSDFCGMNKVLPMNSGAEAVETAIKIARKWGYKVKGVEKKKAEIIVCEDNFHGRTTTIVGFSTVDQYRDGFGPFTPGFKVIPFGDAWAFANAITPNTVAFLVEPIQGEGGVIIPPEGYLREVCQICNKENVLLLADEIQTGFGRTGLPFAFDYEGIRPDIIIMGKALGGGLLPVSAVAADTGVMDVIKPGDHGSTFGGNPLACAVAIEAISVLADEGLIRRAGTMGVYFMYKLKKLKSKRVKEVRGKGLLIGVELVPQAGGARQYCEQLMRRGILCKETREDVIRFAPPLIITKEEIDYAMERIELVL